VTRQKDALEPRKIGPAAVAVDDYLRALGITGATFTKTKHAQVEFMVGPHRLRMSVPCTPRDDTQAAKESVWRVRKLVIETCARAT